MSGAEPAVLPSGAVLVDVDWLRQRLHDPGLVLLDARIRRITEDDGKTRYASDLAGFETDGHLPGASYADLVDEFSDPQARFNFTRPTSQQLQAAARRVGVNTDDTVIVYDSLNGVWAARLWFLLRAFGHRHVAVLNGGLRRWVANGGALAFGPAPAMSEGDFVATEGDLFVDLPTVSRLVAHPDGSVLLCGLDQAVYTGERPSGAERRGHIPGSRSVPFASVLDPDGAIDAALARARIAELDLLDATRVVTYCGGGINAAGLALAFAAAGLPTVSVFDGSLLEWAADPDLPLELGVDRTAGAGVNGVSAGKGGHDDR